MIQLPKTIKLTHKTKISIGGTTYAKSVEADGPILDVGLVFLGFNKLIKFDHRFNFRLSYQ